MTRQPDSPGRPVSARYDFSRFGRHKLRAPTAAIIDLPVPVVSGAQVWVATLWPDPSAQGGWARQVWTLDPVTGRGWQLPHQLAAGDVVEFGADTPAGPVRWYGIMDGYVVDEAATVQGPYPHPIAAWDEAQRLVALDRYVEPLHADQPAPPVDSRQPHRPRRGHCHHHRRRQQRGGTSPI